jgi:hypothetical protein
MFNLSATDEKRYIVHLLVQVNFISREVYFIWRSVFSFCMV